MLDYSIGEMAASLISVATEEAVKPKLHSTRKGVGDEFEESLCGPHFGECHCITDSNAMTVGDVSATFHATAYSG